MKILKIIAALLLIVLSFVLFIIVSIVAFFWLIIYSIKPSKKDTHFLQGLKVYFTEIAASIDQLGNAAFGGFLNWLFIDNIKDAYLHGDKDETISEVLGWNEATNSLSYFGEKMVFILNKLEARHCELAMLSGVNKAHIKIDNYKAIKGSYNIIH